ncbi:hypothetical protein MKK50_15255 [Methylobacterium sp. J-043]|nr:hypothetical protein [Methylobacterium sp. J-043]
MFKFILERIYPDAPKAVSATEIVQGAVIEALTAHLARLGHQVSAVSVPASAMNTDICRFTTAAGSFWVQPGLDPFGDNVITSALPSGTVTNSTTASASVAADTVSTSSDDDLVKLIEAKIVASASIEGGSHYLGAFRPPYLRIDGDLDVTKLATAVLGKLRSAEMIR